MKTQTYFENKLNEGQEYQDFVTDHLYKAGLSVTNYSSLKYQRKGENKGGVEIKFDGNFEKTGNFYIEIAERYSEADLYYSSGIMRNDNAWLYIIGNYSIIYIFSKKFLQKNLMMILLRDGLVIWG